MRGLFEKDIRIIKNQKKMMLIFAGMGVLLLLSGDDERCNQHDQL